MQSPQEGAVSVATADGQARFQMVLPMNPLLFDVATAIKQTASQVGLLLMPIACVYSKESGEVGYGT
jgi:hypothetical protein